MGTLANSRLRKLRDAAHKAFDPLWNDGGTDRDTAYMAASLVSGVANLDFHIGHLDEAACLKFIEQIDAVERMLEHLSLMRTAPAGLLSDVAVDVLVELFPATDAGGMVPLIPRATLNAYPSIAREALMVGAICPDPGSMYRLTRAGLRQVAP